MTKSLCVSIAVMFFLAHPVAAQVPTSEYATRRDTVAAHLGDGVLLSFGAGEPMTDEADFHQLPAFEYLTGYRRVNAVFVMAMKAGKVTYAMLFEPPIDPRRALYDGFAPDSADLQRRTGLGLRNSDQLRDVLDGMASRGTLWTVTDAHSRDYRSTDSLSAERYFVQRFWAAHPAVTIRSADALLDSLMVVKSPAELALLRKAVEISAQGQVAAMKAVHPGVNEGEIHALTDYTFRMAGATGAVVPCDHRVGPQLDELSLPRERPGPAGGRDRRNGHGRAVRWLCRRRDAHHSGEREVLGGPGGDLHHRALGADGGGARGEGGCAGGQRGEGDPRDHGDGAGEAGADRGTGCDARPAVGRCGAMRAGAGGVHAGVHLHGARTGARHRARGARCGRVLVLTDRATSS